MIIKNILGNLEDYAVGARRLEKVKLEWFELEKRRLRKTLESGEEIGICLEEANPTSNISLREGDVLYEDGVRVVAVAVVPCGLAVIEVAGMREMGRLCFELGNRHLSLKIEENKVTIPYDEPTFRYLDKLGFSLERVEGRFSDFMVCRAHGSSHGHTHDHVHAGGGK